MPTASSLCKLAMQVNRFPPVLYQLKTRKSLDVCVVVVDAEGCEYKDGRYDMPIVRRGT